MALVHCHFFSQTLGRMTALSALLPEPGQDCDPPDEPVRYPTLYLLHGRKRQNSRICFSLSLPVIVGHLFLWRPLL